MITFSTVTPAENILKVSATNYMKKLLEIYNNKVYIQRFHKFKIDLSIFQKI
jgi:hypothetical protein